MRSTHFRAQKLVFFFALIFLHSACQAPNSKTLASKSISEKWRPLLSSEENQQRVERSLPKKLISFDVVDKDLRQLVQDIGHEVGVRILVAPDVDERVTLALRNINCYDALTILSSIKNCELTIGAGGFYTFGYSYRITANFGNARLSTVLKFVAACGRLDAKIDSSSPHVRVLKDCEEMHWRDVILQLCKIDGLVAFIDANQKNLLIRVISAPPQKNTNANRRRG